MVEKWRQRQTAKVGQQVTDFETHWQEHRTRLHCLVVRLSGCPDAADDILQEVGLHAYEGFAKFKNGSSVYTWLYRIALNDTLRWRERRPKVSIALDTPEALEVSSLDADPHKQSENSDLRRKIWGALETLPEDIRTTLILQLYEGLKYREIATTLNIPIGTVKSRLHTGMQLLRKELKDYAL